METRFLHFLPTRLWIEHVSLSGLLLHHPFCQQVIFFLLHIVIYLFLLFSAVNPQSVLFYGHQARFRLWGRRQRSCLPPVLLSVTLLGYLEIQEEGLALTLLEYLEVFVVVRGHLGRQCYNFKSRSTRWEQWGAGTAPSQTWNKACRTLKAPYCVITSCCSTFSPFLSTLRVLSSYLTSWRPSQAGSAESWLSPKDARRRPNLYRKTSLSSWLNPKGLLNQNPPHLIAKMNNAETELAASEMMAETRRKWEEVRKTCACQLMHGHAHTYSDTDTHSQK